MEQKEDKAFPEVLRLPRVSLELDLYIGVEKSVFYSLASVSYGDRGFLFYN